MRGLGLGERVEGVPTSSSEPPSPSPLIPVASASERRACTVRGISVSSSA